MEWAKKYWKVALTGGAVALLLVIVAPVFGSTPVNADHLRLVDGQELFFYGDDEPGGATVLEQFLTTGGNTCEITLVGDSIVSLDSNNEEGNVKDPGTFDLGLGVKSKGANGTPCAETSHPEELRIQAADGQKWIELRLDSQPKQDAWVIVTLWDEGVQVGATHQLLTGGAIEGYNTSNGGDPDEFIKDTDLPYEATTGEYLAGYSDANDNLYIEACANPSDSGPDSGINDNCIWHVVSQVSFDEVRITTLEGWGSIAIEGGGDYGGWDPTAYGMDGDSWDTLFYRALSATDDAYSVDEDQVLNIAADGVLGNDSLPPGAVTLTVTDDVDNGSVVLSNDGSFTYTPDPNYNGPDSFTYQATAGGQIDTAVVSITVNPVNDPPEPIVDPPIDPATEEVLSDPYLVEDFATDIDAGDSLTITSASAANGTIDLAPDRKSFTYTSDTDFCGTETLTLFIEDLSGEPTDPDPLVISLEVICVNDAPTADDDTYEMDERDPSDFNASATLSVPAAGVLDGDTDPDTGIDPPNAVLTVAARSVTSPVPGGALNVLSDGSFTYTPVFMTPTEWETLGVFSYDVTFDYDVTDGEFSDTGSVTITVHRVICSDESVRDTDGDVTGAFTLLKPAETDPDKCKRYGVTADHDSQTVTFAPEGDGLPLETFRGLLSFSPQFLFDGTFSLGLEYDPNYDPDFPGNYVPQPMILCINPQFETGLLDFPGVPAGFMAPLVVSATIPAGESWCLAGEITVASGNPAVLVTIFQVIGDEDPRFGFR